MHPIVTLLIAFASLVIAVRFVGRAWRSPWTPSRAANLWVLSIFVLTSVISTVGVRSWLDARAPLLALYTLNVLLGLAATGILFNILYQWGYPVRRALRGAATLATLVTLLLTWLYLTEMRHLPPFDWERFTTGAPVTPKQAVFALTILLYMDAVGALAVWQQARQVRREISPFVRGRLTMSLVSVSATTAFFVVLTLHYGVNKLGLPLHLAPRQESLAWLGLISVISCALWAWQPKRLLAWPWQVWAAWQIAPLQQQLARYCPPLFLKVPQGWERLLRPQHSLSLALVHALDSTQLLAAHPDPAAQRLATQLQNAQLGERNFDEAIQTCVEISRHLA